MALEPTDRSPQPLRLIFLRYTLRNGAHGTLHYVAPSTGDALVALLDLFGTDVRSCSAVPA